MIGIGAENIFGEIQTASSVVNVQARGNGVVVTDAVIKHQAVSNSSLSVAGTDAFGCRLKPGVACTSADSKAELRSGGLSYEAVSSY